MFSTYVVIYIQRFKREEIIMKANVKRISVVLMLVMMVFTFAACGGSETAAPTAVPGADGTLSADKTDKLNIYLCGTYVDENCLDALKSVVSAAVGDGVTVTYDTISTGGGSDPSMQMAGMMKLTAAIAAKEVDIIIADETNAARNARSEAFYALSDVMTADEISALGERALAYDMLNDDGSATGEKTPICGVDLTGDEVVTSAMGNVSAGAFVAGNAANLENAKTVIKALAERTTAE